MRFDLWASKDCSGKPFRAWHCPTCGRYDVAAYQWIAMQCDCGEIDVSEVGEIHGQLVVWEEAAA